MRRRVERGRLGESSSESSRATLARANLRVLVRGDAKRRVNGQRAKDSHHSGASDSVHPRIWVRLSTIVLHRHDEGLVASVFRVWAGVVTNVIGVTVRSEVR